MSEEATSAAPAAEAAPSVTDGATENWADSPIAKVYHPDGTLRSNAGDSFKELGHEDLSGFATRNDQSFFDALKNGKEARAGHSQRQESVDNTVVKPGEAATPEDLAAYREGLGALPSAEAYKKALIPSDLPEGAEFDDNLASMVSEWATKHPVNTPEAMQEHSLHTLSSWRAWSHPTRRQLALTSTRLARRLTSYSHLNWVARSLKLSLTISLVSS